MRSIHPYIILPVVIIILLLLGCQRGPSYDPPAESLPQMDEKGFIEVIDSLVLSAYHEPEAAAVAGDSLKKLLNERGDLDRKVLGKLFYLETAIEYVLGNYSQALEHAYQALPLLSGHKDSSELCIVWSTMGALHMYRADYDSSLYYLLNAHQYFENCGDMENFIRTSINLSGTYYYTEQPLESLEYLRIALEAHESYDNPRTLSRILVNTGIMLGELGRTEDARDTLLLALEESLKLREVSILSDCYNNLALLEMKEGNYLPALEYFGKLLDAGRERSDRFILCEAHNHMSVVFDSLGRPQDALDHALRSYRISGDIGSDDHRATAARRLADLYSSAGRHSLALDYLEEYISLREQILNEAKSRQIVEMETRYQTRQQQEALERVSLEKRLVDLKAQRLQLLFLISMPLFLLLFLTGFLLVRQNNLKNRQKQLDLEQKLFRLQLNPHFIFNALAVIQSSIMRREKEDALQLTGSFARLMRQILHGSEHELIGLGDELKMMEDYLVIQQKRYGELFNWEVSRELEAEDDIQVPPMMIQPFVENAIEHGLRPLKKGGELLLRATVEEKRLRIRIRDNGIGRKEAEKKRDPTHHSMATGISFLRFRNLRRKYRQPFDLDIIDLRNAGGDAAGTEVLISLPLDLNEEKKGKTYL